jgi:hypothetical protein
MSGPRPLRALLDAWKPAGRRADGGDEANMLAAAWAEAVGNDIARRTRTAKYRDGTLAVLTAGSAWSHQLTFLAPTIIERLRARVPGVPLRRLRFTIATGRTRILLDRGIENGLKGPLLRGKTGSKDPVPQGPAPQGPLLHEGERSLDEVMAALRMEQEALDRQRSRAGWQRCVECGVWRPGPARAVGPASRCEPCADMARRKADARIAHSLNAAPWLSHDDIVKQVAGATKHAFQRVSRRLRSAWEQHLAYARARMRRGALEPGDRVVAWSFMMLVAHRPQAEIGRAVVEDLLGREWANALFDEHTKISRNMR